MNPQNVETQYLCYRRALVDGDLEAANSILKSLNNSRSSAVVLPIEWRRSSRSPLSSWVLGGVWVDRDTASRSSSALPVPTSAHDSANRRGPPRAQLDHESAREIAVGRTRRALWGEGGPLGQVVADFDNNSTILLENIPDNDGGEYEVEVTLPDLECDNCTLQVIQVMLDKPPYGDGNDLYYQCADVILEFGAATSGSTGEGSTGDDTSGGSTGDGSTGDGTGDGSTSEPGGTTGDGGSTGAGGSAGTSAGSSSDGGSAGGSTGGGTDSDSGMTDDGCGCRGDAGGTRGLGLALLLGGLCFTRRRRASGR